MRSRNLKPQVNAGSMADIAFLLLIFFLVTATIPNDQGFNRKLPKLCKTGDCGETLPERNVFRIILNAKNQLLVKNELTAISDLKNSAKTFIDNNGKGECTYCSGDRSSDASDGPKSAVISLQVHPNSNYEAFIKIQDELTKAYYELRGNYALNIFKKELEDLSQSEKRELKEVYPFIVSEATIK